MFVGHASDTVEIGQKIYIFHDDGFEDQGIVTAITHDAVRADFFDWLQEWPVQEVFWHDDGLRRILTSAGPGVVTKTFGNR